MDSDAGFVYKIYHNDQLLWTSEPNATPLEYENLWVAVGDSNYPAAHAMFNGWSLRMFSDTSSCAGHSCGPHSTCTESKQTKINHRLFFTFVFNPGQTNWFHLKQIAYDVL